MSVFFRILITMTASAILLTACAEAPQTPEGQTVVVTPAIRGNSAVLNIGDTLEIQIPTIPSEGFEWLAQDLDTTILLQEGDAVYNEATDPDSAGGIVTLRFAAVGSGQTTITLLYTNAKSGSALSISKDSFGMTVEVK
jgi:predicted secreted protein